MEVVLLEPDRTLRELLSWMLRYHGHRVVAVDDLAPATVQEALHEAPFAILHDGLQGTSRATLRALVWQRGQRPTVVLVGGPETSRAAADFAIPEEWCLSLPLQPALLRDLVASLQAEDQSATA